MDVATAYDSGENFSNTRAKLSVTVAVRLAKDIIETLAIVCYSENPVVILNYAAPNKNALTNISDVSKQWSVVCLRTKFHLAF